MLGHDNVSVNPQGEAGARVFQNLDEQIIDRRRIEIVPPVLAGKSHEMSLAGLLKALEAVRHGKELSSTPCVDAVIADPG
jgi:hypothetical protein